MDSEKYSTNPYLYKIFEKIGRDSNKQISCSRCPEKCSYENKFCKIENHDAEISIICDNCFARFESMSEYFDSEIIDRYHPYIRPQKVLIIPMLEEEYCDLL